KVLLAAPKLTQSIYRDMLSPLGFGGIETTHDDQRAISLMKKIKPRLVVATMSLSVFTGPQLLTAAREEPATRDIPFLIIGVKEDLKPGGLAEQVNSVPLARFAGLPLSQEQFCEVVLKFMDPLLDPKQEEAYRLFDQADESSKAGDPVRAAETYRQGLDLYDRNLDAWLNYGALLADLGRSEEAETAYFKALDLNNYSLMAYLGLAEIYEGRQDYEQTIGILRQALGLAHIVKLSSHSVSRINFFIGEFELRLKRLTGAEDSFGQAIAEAPDDAGLRTDIGDAYAEKGYYTESEKHYQAALEIDPSLAHVYNRLGIAYRRQQKYDKALNLYDKALIYHPEDEHLLFNIARAHFEAEHEEEAMDKLETALTISPNFKEAKFLISQLRNTMSNIERFEGRTEARIS
ncbi:MAG: tetratricopeptide repeat protein, partial [Thermodesulfobacteriota bacterium]